jgi:hypothetical protein
VELALVYRMDPRAILELDPELLVTMRDVAEEVAG